MLKKLLMLSSCILLSAALFTAKRSVYAQDSGTVTLDDQTPSVDVIITPANGAPGVVYAELDGVQLQLSDSTGTEALTMLDKRVLALGIQVAQGTAASTLHLQRLPGISVAHVKLTPQATLPQVSVAAASQPVQVLDAPVTTKIDLSPTISLPVQASGQNNMLSVQFGEQPVTAQLTDGSGTSILASQGSLISGLAIHLDTGSYTLNVTNSDTSTTSSVLVSLSTSPALTIGTMAVAVQPTATPTLFPTIVPTVMPTSTSQPQPTATAVACIATVTSAYVNVRSGPSIGYDVLGRVPQNSELLVSGTNRESSWWQVQSNFGTGWISNTTAVLDGSCDALPIYEITAQNSQQPPLGDGAPAPRIRHDGRGEGGDD